jgi:hypothetical protein
MSGKPRPVAEERDEDGALDMSLRIDSITLSGRSLGPTITTQDFTAAGLLADGAGARSGDSRSRFSFAGSYTLIRSLVVDSGSPASL